VRLFNDAPREWSMINLDNVSFTAVVPPPDAEPILDPPQIVRRVHICETPPTDTLTITNGGVGTLVYTIKSDVGWLSVSPEAGASEGEADPITLSYDMEGLGVGQYPTTITIESNAWNSPHTVPVTLDIWTVRPDSDADGDVDQEDFGRFQACLSGPGIIQSDPECLFARFDEDEDADAADLSRFLACLSGPGVCADPACESEPPPYE